MIILRLFIESVCLNSNHSKRDVLLRQLRVKGCQGWSRLPCTAEGFPSERSGEPCGRSRPGAAAAVGPTRGTISLERHQNTDVSEPELDRSLFASLWSRHSLKFHACAWGRNRSDFFMLGRFRCAHSPQMVVDLRLAGRPSPYQESLFLWSPKINILWGYKSPLQKLA